MFLSKCGYFERNTMAINTVVMSTDSYATRRDSPCRPVDELEIASYGRNMAMGQPQSRRGASLGALLVAFLVTFVISSSLTSFASSSATHSTGPQTDNEWPYYCLINTDAVSHFHDAYNQFYSQTLARSYNNCGANVHPAEIRTQTVGWKGNSICFASPQTEFISSNPLSLPHSVTVVRRYGYLIGPGPSLPCGNGTYTAAGNHEGWWWPGGITKFQHFSTPLYLHNHSI